MKKSTRNIKLNTKPFRKNSTRNFRNTKLWRKIPETIKQRREQELNELGQKIQTFEQVANQDIQQQQQKLMAPIYEKINTAIKAVGDENGYTYILEDSQVIYKNPTANDVTPLVKAKLNLKDAPATPATTPAKK